MNPPAFTAILCAIALWLLPGLAFAAEPPFYLWLQYGGTHATNPGGMNNDVVTRGWPQYVKDIQAWLDWAGPEAGVVTHNAFGCWNKEGMEIDSHDFALASGVENITRDFAKAWKPVCDKRVVLAYVGNASWHKRLVDMPPEEFAALVRRNLKPYKDAHFAGVILDAAGDAIAVPHEIMRMPDGSRKPKYPISRDAATLALIDGMEFPRRTAIEPTPRKFGPWAELTSRGAWIEERHFVHIHKTDNAKADGYGKDRRYIKGPVHRILYHSDPWSDTPEKMVEYARKIVAEGDVPAVPPWFLVGKCQPSDFLGAK